jgi:hypothetical protein
MADYLRAHTETLVYETHRLHIDLGATEGISSVFICHYRYMSCVPQSGL